MNGNMFFNKFGDIRRIGQIVSLRAKVTFDSIVSPTALCLQ